MENNNYFNLCNLANFYTISNYRDCFEDYSFINFKKPIIIITGGIGLGKSILGKQLALLNPEIQVLVCQDLNHISRKIYNLILDNIKSLSDSKIIHLSDQTHKYINVTI